MCLAAGGRREGVWSGTAPPGGQREDCCSRSYPHSENSEGDREEGDTGTRSPNLLPACLPVCLSVRRVSVCLSVCLVAGMNRVCLSVYQSAHVSVCLCTCLSARWWGCTGCVALRPWRRICETVLRRTVQPCASPRSSTPTSTYSQVPWSTTTRTTTTAGTNARTITSTVPHSTTTVLIPDVLPRVQPLVQSLVSLLLMSIVKQNPVFDTLTGSTVLQPELHTMNTQHENWVFI